MTELEALRLKNKELISYKVSTLDELLKVKNERDTLFLELGKYADIPSFEFWKDKYHKLEAENLQMRKSILALFEGCNIHEWNNSVGHIVDLRNVLLLPHAARLARRLELLERVIQAVRNYQQFRDFHHQDALMMMIKNFDELDKESK